jgi:hypothetical protein
MAMMITGIITQRLVFQPVHSILYHYLCCLLP